MAVPTLDGLKAHLNFANDDTYDSELLTFLGAARRMIEAYTGPLEASTVTQRVTGHGRTLVVTVRPVLSVTSVTAAVGGGTLDVSSLSVAGSAGVLTSQTLLSGEWTVVYSAGLSSVSDAVELAVYVTSQHLWQTQRGGGKRPGTQPEAQPGVGYALPRMALELVQADMSSLGFA